MIRPPKSICWFISGAFLLILACASAKDSFHPDALPENTQLQTVVQTGHAAPITSVSFSYDGRYVLSGSKDHTMKLWDVFSGREIRTFRGHTDTVSTVAFVPRSRLVISGSWDHTLKI